MERLVAVPSAALSLSVLALGATIDAHTNSGTPTAGTLASILGLGVGLGLNLSTLAPILTLGWHALTFLPRYRHRPATAAAAAAAARHHYRSLSTSSVSSAEAPSVVGVEEDEVSSARTRIWTPHTLALVWFLNTILTLVAPTWTTDTAFAYAGLAVLSGLEAGVLALGAVLAQYQLQRELEGDVDSECGWEEEEEEMKLNDL